MHLYSTVPKEVRNESGCQDRPGADRDRVPLQGVPLPAAVVALYHFVAERGEGVVGGRRSETPESSDDQHGKCEEQVCCFAFLSISKLIEAVNDLKICKNF